MPLKGIPLIAHAIKAAKDSRLFRHVYLSTDDEAIATIGREYGAVAPYTRPSQLATPASSLVDVALDFVNFLEARDERYEELCLLMPTSPLRVPDDIVRSYEIFRSRQCSFLMSVTRYATGSPFWALQMDSTECVKPIFGFDYFKDTHDQSNVYCPSGVVRWAKIEALRAEQTFYGKETVGYKVPITRSVEIDEPEDVEVAEALMSWKAHV